MQVLHERHSTRSFADKPIPVEVLSSLLWAAQGVNGTIPTIVRRRLPGIQ
ncbi:MAG: nitroreductase family protein [Akkermansia sp.]